MKKTIKLILILSLLSFFGCKKEVNKAKTENLKNEKNFKQQYTIKELQGFWDSYSYYLEHESEFKDFNKNKYYKIISGNQMLEIKLIDHDIKNIIINTYDLGFLDTNKISHLSTKKHFLENLKRYGNTLVRLQKNTKEYHFSKIEISKQLIRDYDVTEILNDGFNYDKKNSDFNFKTLTTLPKGIFLALKENSLLDTINYLKEFSVFKTSLKAKIKTAKTFFYSNKTAASKRKAFLIKDDLVYIEAIDDTWLKVYFDGKTVSHGYIKKVDAELLLK